MASNMGSWVTGLGCARVVYVRVVREVEGRAAEEGRRRRRGRARELIVDADLEEIMVWNLRPRWFWWNEGRTISGKVSEKK